VAVSRPQVNAPVCKVKPPGTHFFAYEERSHFIIGNLIPADLLDEHKVSFANPIVIHSIVTRTADETMIRVARLLK
jgi:hypothetical protein